MKENSKRTVLITGGSSGIGLASAKKYIEQNYQVIIVGKTEDKLITAVNEIGGDISSYVVDVTQIDNLKDLYEQLWMQQIEIDILVTSAGLGKFGSVLDVSEKDYDLVMNTNTKGTFFTVSILKPLIKRGGHVVLISSFLASKHIPLTSVLSSSKIAVETFTKIFAREFLDDKIKVNAISPGSIKSNFMSFANPTEEQQKILTANMPKILLEKRGEAIQVADAICFLTSEKADYINGAILSVDGGISVS